MMDSLPSKKKKSSVIFLLSVKVNFEVLIFFFLFYGHVIGSLEIFIKKGHLENKDHGKREINLLSECGVQHCI